MFEGTVTASRLAKRAPGPTTLWMAALLLGTMVMQGCITTAVIATTTLLSKGKEGEDTKRVPVQNTAAVHLSESQEEVYAAMIRIIERSQGIKVHKRDPKTYTVEASHGDDRVTAQAIALPGGLTDLVVTAMAGTEGLDDRDLAVDVVKKICDELGIPHQTVPIR